MNKKLNGDNPARGSRADHAEDCLAGLHSTGKAWL